MGQLPPALLAAIQAKAQSAQGGGPMPPGQGMPGDITGPGDGVHTKPVKKPVAKKKSTKKLGPADKKAAMERRLSKSGSSKPNPFAGK